MIKLLIVDDEVIIRNSLKNKIECSDNEIIFEEAKDGIEALQIALNLRPDIVITDVRMPQMNGIQFITELKKILPDIQTIFISGYNEFDYVKSALELESCAYVLKPIKKHELNCAVQKAVERIRQYSLLNSSTHMQLNLLDKFLESFYNGTVASLTDFDIILKNLHFHRSYFQVLLVRFSDTINTADYAEQTLNSAVAFLSSEYTGRIISVSNRNFVIFLTSSKPVELISYSKTLIKQLSIKYSLDISIVLGRQSDSIEAVPEIFKEARDSLKFLHLYNTHEIILPQEQAEPSWPSSFPEHIARTIIDHIYTGNSVLLEDAVGSLDDFIQSSPAMTLYSINHIFSQILSDILRILYERQSPKTLIDQGISLMHRFSACNLQEDFSNQFLEYCKCVISSFQKSTSIDEIMHDAAAYIDAHYNEDITLKKIAAFYYLNSSYFSISFKTITGRNFNEYLTNVRIEHAKKLLENESIKINEVARLVGYEDTSYFGKTFRKHTGILPSEYRRRSLSK